MLGQGFLEIREEISEHLTLLAPELIVFFPRSFLCGLSCGPLAQKALQVITGPFGEALCGLGLWPLS